MRYRAFRVRGAVRWLAIVVALALVAPLHAFGQARATQAPSPTAKESSAIDLTGYWVSVVTQNWRLRMVPPAKGDYMGIPLTVEAKKIADAWDPAKDEASGQECKAYGAAGIMTQPERIHITWRDDNTLRVDIDAGTQTRLLHFGDWKQAGVKPTRQGDSVADWVARRGPGIGPSSPRAKYLKVTTTHMLSGYLRKNGVPYSENAVLTEDYDIFKEPTGETWLIVTTKVEDPLYLDAPLILTAQFRKQANDSGWDPTPCSVRW